MLLRISGKNLAIRLARSLSRSAREMKKSVRIGWLVIPASPAHPAQQVPTPHQHAKTTTFLNCSLPVHARDPHPLVLERLDGVRMLSPDIAAIGREHDELRPDATGLSHAVLVGRRIS